MRYLLDTHIFLWWITDNPKLKQHIRDVIGDKRNQLFLSSASIWEMMIKSNLNKLNLSLTGHFIVSKGSVKYSVGFGTGRFDRVVLG